MSIHPGALVSYREREWIVLPSDDPNLILLRPLGGSTRETCGVIQSLSNVIGFSLPYERIMPAQFPLPMPEDAQDHQAVRLLLDAARLLLREGATPFRSLGHLSVRPRPYQLVPLIMALRLDTVRLLIADDVGVGKTIEAGLIARELLDRGEVRRLAVLCPPYLCEQWQKELAEKFHIEAAVIRSGTVAKLERAKPVDKSIFEHYTHFIASIDTVKSERYRAAFVQHCPELVLVDEVHGAAAPRGQNAAQQQRYELLASLAIHSPKAQERHFVMLSATPHSGVQESFLSLLGLLKPEFAHLNLNAMTETDRIALARHFVQRRRGDVRDWMGEQTPFPERDMQDTEQPYTFSKEYRSFYEDVYVFAGELVRSAENLTGWRRRMRYWSALALLRCVTSSPAAAEAALERRDARSGSGEALDPLDETSLTPEELDVEFAPVVRDSADTENSVDAPPNTVFDRQEQDQGWQDRDRRRLREFARTARKLRGRQDNKVQKAITVVRNLLIQGYHPIIWCRYIATAEYVAATLQSSLVGEFQDLRVVPITGALADDERRILVEDLGHSPQRILVATDCLSEGINLQEYFSAAVHYDLPWNPNRLEQREGRVDRFGQPSPRVKAVLIFGQDNPVDGAVLEVLLRKARELLKVLGVSVPVPVQSDQVMEAVLTSLFAGESQVEDYRQPSLFDTARSDDASTESEVQVARLHKEWTEATQREQVNRTRFAQRAIRPEEVQTALKETDSVLGDPQTVRRFLVATSQRLPFGFHPRQVGQTSNSTEQWEVAVPELPEPVRLRLDQAPARWLVTFNSPAPPGIAYIGRNHPLVEGLAEYLLDQAFHPGSGPRAVSRAGVIRTHIVTHRTTLFLLRLRYLQRARGADRETLAEETIAWGLRGIHPDLTELTTEESQYLLDTAQPSQNIAAWERPLVLGETLSWWPELTEQLDALLAKRAAHIEEMHREVRRVLQQRVLYIRPQMPPDLLGVVVLLPAI